MDFQITALPVDQFLDFFEMTEAELAQRQARRQVVTENPGTPCRVSMVDADIGETVILCNYAHQSGQSPYYATHAIFVREHAVQADLAINEVPEVIRTRLMSVRLFDKDHMMIDADVLHGEELPAVLPAIFGNDKVEYVHLHNAKPGCFAASVVRADA